MKKIAGLFFLLWMCSASSHAQYYAWQSDHFTKAEGLSHNAVNNLYEDSRGLIWVCTRYGVNRFDGTTFRWYTREENGLHSNDIQQVYEDKDGLLWMLTGMDGYATADFYDRFDFTIFNPYTQESELANDHLSEAVLADVRSCDVYTQLPDKSILFVSNEGFAIRYYGKGLSERIDFPLRYGQVVRCLPADSNKVLLFLSDQLDPNAHPHLLHLESGKMENGRGKAITSLKLTTVDAPPMFAGADIIRLFEDEQGRLIYYGILRPDGQWRVSSLEDDFAPELLELDDRLVYLDPARGRYWVERGSETLLLEKGVVGVAGRLATSKLPAFLRLDSRGNLLGIHKNAGFSRYGFVENPFRIIGLSGVGYRGITEDEQGALWVGIDRTSYNRQLRSNPADFPRLTHNHAVLTAANGDVYTGMPTNLEENTISTHDFLRKFSAGGSGDPEIYQQSRPLEQELWTIWEDPRDGFIWTANINGIVSRTDPVSKQSERILDRQTPGWSKDGILVYAMHEGEAGRTWLSTSAGLYTLDRHFELTKRYAYATEGALPFPAKSVHHCYVDEAGLFWIATGDAGLVHWDPSKEKVLCHYTLADGLPSMILHAVYADSVGHLWIPSEDGIIQFNPETEMLNVFRPEQGTSDREYNRISHYRAPDGRLYFGGISGLTTFHPRDLHQQQALEAGRTYIVPLDVLQTEGKSSTVKNSIDAFRQSGQITIDPGVIRTRLTLRSPEIGNAPYVMYSQVLGWQEQAIPVEQSTILLDGLPYGRNMLQVVAKSINGEELQSLEIPVLVKRPFVQRWWFVLLVTLLLLGVGAGVVSLDNQRLRNVVAARTAEIEKDRQTILEQAAELRRIDASKSRIFANVSHELRTPLTLIVGPLKRLLQEEKGLSAPAVRNLQRAYANGKELMHMVNDILNLTKLEHHKLAVYEEPTQITPFFTEMLDLFKSHGKLRKVDLDVDLLFPKGFILCIDRKKVETLVRNLLSNALKFSQQGGLVSFRAAWEAEVLEIRVTDRGKGIHPEDQPHVFDRFYQSKHNLETATGGTGIGLAICKNYTELLGGTIHLESELGRGSSFTVRLPAAVSPHEEIAFDLLQDTTPLIQARHQHNSINYGKARRSSHLHRLLIVEDNPDLVAYLEELLEQKYVLITAQNGQLALDQLAEIDAQERLPDLIITDLMMPEMDGFQLLQLLKADPRYQLIPTIVLSARADLDGRLQALRTGIDDYLIKPFDELELQLRISNLLENARQRNRFIKERQLAVADEPIQRPFPAAPPVAAVDQAWLDRVTQLVKDNLSDHDFGNEALAGLLFVSSRTLNRQLGALTGLTTNKFMLEIRLTEARKLLEKHPRPNLDTVADAVGFKTTSYLSKKFRERFGKLPSAY